MRRIASSRCVSTNRAECIIYQYTKYEAILSISEWLAAICSATRSLPPQLSIVWFWGAGERTTLSLPLVCPHARGQDNARESTKGAQGTTPELPCRKHVLRC